ncbi:MAG: diaminopimelate decarboxylase [Anaerolineales bacterium]|nr:diaminopimelate decarboxylase [Anaerolineales bacterium]
MSHATTKPLPCSAQRLAAIADEVPTPFYLYDEQGIRAAARALLAAFAWAPHYTQYFAVKATPTPRILQILREEGSGADCSSLPELRLAERTGFVGEQICFTSNNTPADEFAAAHALGAIINLDDVGHLAFVQRHVGLPDLVSFRYNPGQLATGNAIIGQPERSKFGVTKAQLFEGYRMAQAQGVRRFGLHAMLVSNEREIANLVATARLLFELAAEIAQRLKIQLEFINIGGGIGIPYHPDEPPVDLAALGDGIRRAYDETLGHLPPIALFTECGRAITGPHGYLVTRVRHVKATYRHYAGVDATMADLMRPALYDAYHHISVVGREQEAADRRYDVTGSLCENNDKFAVDRALPRLERGDLLVIHDAGAHGRAMGFNYNGKLRPAELLLRPNGDLTLIRRAETLADYFATLDVEADFARG